MNCSDVGKFFGFECSQVNERTAYIQAPITYGWDGGMVGAYIEEIGADRIRVSDNSDVLFTAITHGVDANNRLLKKLKMIASSHDVELSDAGEISVVSSKSAAQLNLVRFFSAADDIVRVCGNVKPAPTSAFEKTILKVLKEHYGERLSRMVKVRGASGHELTIPFVLDDGEGRQRFISPVSAPRDRPNWKSVYQTAGKYMDLKSSNHPARRMVVLERSEEVETNHAINVLSQTAEVITYESDMQLISVLAKAA